MQEVSKAVSDYIKRETEKNPDFMPSLLLDEEAYNKRWEELVDEAEHQLTKVSTQLIKIRKIPALDMFMRHNLDSVDSMGKTLILKESEFKRLIADCGFPDTQIIDILYDSNTTFCKVVCLTREAIALALSEKTISVKRYDELMKTLDDE
jgi:hypothetical protein